MIGKALGNYARTVARSVSSGWDGFWFTPADPTLLGVLRILTGLMLVYTHAVWGLDLEAFYGPDGWLSADLVHTMQRDEFAYSFWWYVPADAIWPIHWASMTVLVLFTLGLFTPLTSVLSLIVAISYAQRVPAALFGLDQINVMLTLYLTVGGSGQALALDRWIFRRRTAADFGPAPSVRANIGQRLIQVHMCVIYFFAGIAKLTGPAWWDGTAMWRAFTNLEYQSADMTWLAWHPWLINLMTHVTVAWEVSFCVLIWRPLWRPVMLVLSVLLHVGIGACLGMWTFGLIMLVGCASFLPNEPIRHLVAALTRRRTADASLFSRPACGALRALEEHSARPASGAAKWE